MTKDTICNILWKYNSFFKNQSHSKGKNRSRASQPYVKINWKYIQDINATCKTIRLLKGNIDREYTSRCQCWQ